MKGTRAILAALVTIAACSGGRPTESEPVETPPGNARFLGQWYMPRMFECDSPLWTISMRNGAMVGQVQVRACDPGPPQPLPVTPAYPIIRVGSNLAGGHPYRFLPHGPGDADDALVSDITGEYFERYAP